MKNLTSAILLVFFCLLSNAQSQKQIHHSCPPGSQPAIAHITGTITTYDCATSSSKEDCQKSAIKSTQLISYNQSYCVSDADIKNFKNECPNIHLNTSENMELSCKLTFENE